MKPVRAVRWLVDQIFNGDESTEEQDQEKRKQKSQTPFYEGADRLAEEIQ